MAETSQRSVTVCITEVDGVVTPFYTYTSPKPPAVYINAPACSVTCYEPTDIYFLSDYATTTAGWTVVNAVGNPDLPGPVKVDPNGEYLVVSNPHNKPSTVFKFYLVYTNPAYPGQPGRPAGQYWFDPETGNQP